MKILDIQHVDKVYGSRDIPVRALSDVSFSAEQGEFAAIVGASGSGKSTLLNLIGGARYTYEGERDHTGPRYSRAEAERADDFPAPQYRFRFPELQPDAGA